MSIIMHSPYLKWTQLLCVIWWYHLWAPCPCLSCSAVTMHVNLSHLHSRLLSHRCCALALARANLKCTCTFVSFLQFTFLVYGHTVVSRYTHTSCSAVPLVWGSLDQGCPNKYRHLAIGGRYFITNYTQVETAQFIQTSSQCCQRTSTFQINSQFVSQTDEQNHLKMITFRCCLDKW